MVFEFSWQEGLWIGHCWCTARRVMDFDFPHQSVRFFICILVLLSWTVLLVIYLYISWVKIMVHRINLLKNLLHLLFLGKCGYICVTLDIFYFSLWGELRFLYFLQGFAPKLLNWSHPCIHWQPNWLKIPVGSSKLWFECSYS